MRNTRYNYHPKLCDSVSQCCLWSDYLVRRESGLWRVRGVPVQPFWCRGWGINPPPVADFVLPQIFVKTLTGKTITLEVSDFLCVCGGIACIETRNVARHSAYFWAGFNRLPLAILNARQRAPRTRCAQSTGFTASLLLLSSDVVGPGVCRGPETLDIAPCARARTQNRTCLAQRAVAVGAPWPTTDRMARREIKSNVCC